MTAIRRNRRRRARACTHGRRPMEMRLVGRISPEQYLEFFNSTGKIWLLHLTGGEPFFHPDFVRLCRTLTSRHFISVNSNLSSHRVRDFAAEIDRSRARSDENQE